MRNGTQTAKKAISGNTEACKQKEQELLRVKEEKLTAHAQTPEETKKGIRKSRNGFKVDRNAVQAGIALKMIQYGRVVKQKRGKRMAG